MRDQVNNLDVRNSIDPDDYTASVNGAVIDLKGFESATCVFCVGTVTDGVFTPKVQHGDLANGSDMADLDSTDWTGATFGILLDDSNQRIGYIGGKRYIRQVLTESGASTGAQVCGIVIRANPNIAPVELTSQSSSSSCSSSSSSCSSSSSSSCSSSSSSSSSQSSSSSSSS